MQTQKGKARYAQGRFLVDSVLNFDGQSNYVDFGDSSFLGISSEMTLACMVRVRSLDNIVRFFYDPIVNNVIGTGGYNGFALSINRRRNSNVFTFHAYQGGNFNNPRYRVLFFEKPIEENVWYSIYITISQSSGISAYINGISVAPNRNRVGFAIGQGGDLRVGGNGNMNRFSRYAPVDVANLVILNQSVPASEIYPYTKFSLIAESSQPSAKLLATFDYRSLKNTSVFRSRQPSSTQTVADPSNTLPVGSIVSLNPPRVIVSQNAGVGYDYAEEGLYDFGVPHNLGDTGDVFYDTPSNSGVPILVELSNPIYRIVSATQIQIASPIGLFVKCNTKSFNWKKGSGKLADEIYGQLVNYTADSVGLGDRLGYSSQLLDFSQQYGFRQLFARKDARTSRFNAGISGVDIGMVDNQSWTIVACIFYIVAGGAGEDNLNYLGCNSRPYLSGGIGTWVNSGFLSSKGAVHDVDVFGHGTRTFTFASSWDAATQQVTIKAYDEQRGRVYTIVYSEPQWTALPVRTGIPRSIGMGNYNVQGSRNYSQGIGHLSVIAGQAFDAANLERLALLKGGHDPEEFAGPNGAVFNFAGRGQVRVNTSAGYEVARDVLGRPVSAFFRDATTSTVADFNTVFEEAESRLPAIRQKLKIKAANGLYIALNSGGFPNASSDFSLQWSGSILSKDLPSAGSARMVLLEMLGQDGMGNTLASPYIRISWIKSESGVLVERLRIEYADSPSNILSFDVEVEEDDEFSVGIARKSGMGLIYFNNLLLGSADGFGSSFAGFAVPLMHIGANPNVSSSFVNQDYFAVASFAYSNTEVLSALELASLHWQGIFANPKLSSRPDSRTFTQSKLRLLHHFEDFSVVDNSGTIQLVGKASGNLRATAVGASTIGDVRRNIYGL